MSRHFRFPFSSGFRRKAERRHQHTTDKKIRSTIIGVTRVVGVRGSQRRGGGSVFVAFPPKKSVMSSRRVVNLHAFDPLASSPAPPPPPPPPASPASGPGVAGASPTPPRRLDAQQLRYLQQQGFPPGTGNAAQFRCPFHNGQDYPTNPTHPRLASFSLCPPTTPALCVCVCVCTCIGLIRAFSLNQTPLRIWILDNSASMAVRDSHRIQGTFNNIAKGDGASRWEELQDCVAYQAQAASLFGLPTKFCCKCRFGTRYSSQETTFSTYVSLVVGRVVDT